MNEGTFGEGPKRQDPAAEEVELIEALNAFQPTGDLVEDFTRLTEIRGASMANYQFDHITGASIFDLTDESMYTHFKTLRDLKKPDAGNNPIFEANAGAFDRMIEEYERKHGLS